MKTTLVLIALAACFVGGSLAAVSRGSFADPKHPGKCVVKPDLILSPGDHKDPNSPCGKITCEADGSAQFFTCGAMAAPPGFKFGDYKDLSKPYPDCCAKHIIKA